MAEKNTEFTCMQCNKLFLVIKKENEFYTHQNIPLPTKCMECRRLRRETMRNPRKLFQRTCDKCEISLTSSYPSDCPYPVYCEPCYLESL